MQMLYQQGIVLMCADISFLKEAAAVRVLRIRFLSILQLGDHSKWHPILVISSIPHGGGMREIFECAISPLKGEINSFLWYVTY